MCFKLITPRAEALRTTRHPPSAVLKPPVQHVAEVVRSATAPLPQALLPPLSIRGGTGMASKKPGSTRRLQSRCCQSLSLVHPKRCQISIQGANDIGTAGSAKLRLPFARKGARGNHEEVADHFPRMAAKEQKEAWTSCTHSRRFWTLEQSPPNCGLPQTTIWELQCQSANDRAVAATFGACAIAVRISLSSSPAMFRESFESKTWPSRPASRRKPFWNTFSARRSRSETNQFLLHRMASKWPLGNDTVIHTCFGAELMRVARRQQRRSMALHWEDFLLLYYDEVQTGPAIPNGAPWHQSNWIQSPQEHA